MTRDWVPAIVWFVAAIAWGVPSALFGDVAGGFMTCACILTAAHFADRALNDSAE